MKTVAAALCALVTPLVALAADLDGPWVFKADLGPKFRFSLMCAIKTDGSAISGPCYVAQGRVLAAQGSLDARKFALKYFTTYNGSGIQLDFRGTLQADGSVSGAVSNRLGEGQFQGGAPLAIGDKVKVWTLSTAFPGVSYTVVCAFTQTGSKIAGPCVIPDDESLNLTGTSDGSKIAFDYDTKYQNQPVHAHYEGTMTGGTASGTIAATGANGTFTAKRD